MRLRLRPLKRKIALIDGPDVEKSLSKYNFHIGNPLVLPGDYFTYILNLLNLNQVIPCHRYPTLPVSPLFYADPRPSLSMASFCRLMAGLHATDNYKKKTET